MVEARSYSTSIPGELRSREVRDARTAALAKDHVRPLAALVEELRHKTGRGDRAPWPDPEDGGIGARLLLLLDAPGRAVVDAGFASRDVPHPTLENLFSACLESGLRRADTLIWHAVPWYVGKDDMTKSRAPKVSDLRAGSTWLARAVSASPRLMGVVLFGDKAERAWQIACESDAEGPMTRLPAFRTVTTSAQSFRRDKNRRKELVETLSRIARSMRLV